VPHYRVSVYNYLWRRFQEQGWEFAVLSNRLQPESQLAVQFQYQEAPFSFWQYRRLVKAFKPEVVIFHLLLKEPIFWLLAHWLKFRGIPTICWTKGANLDRPESKARYHLFNYLHSLSAAMLLYSPNEIKHLTPSNRAKVFVANNTVNFEDYPEVTETKEQIKAEFGLPFKKIVLFVGTMGIDGERKKVEHVIKIFGELDRADVGLILVGSGMSDELKARINPRNSRYLGQIHDPKNLRISKLFRAADLFVVPGHVGLGLNQAFYWGLPAVTEQGRQPPEIQYLKPGRNGFMVPEDDLAELKNKILYLLDNDALREEFGRHAREVILKEASIEAMFGSFLKAVEFARAGNEARGGEPGPGLGQRLN
jgi:glycosyltransferase involved in cell wall biosynthesis